MPSADISVSKHILPEDLINISNQDIFNTLVCPVTKSKQREVVTRIFHIEKEIMSKKEKLSDGCKVRFMRVKVTVKFSIFSYFQGSGLVIVKAESEINASVEEIHNYLRDHHSDPTSLMPGAISNEVIKNYNDNLSVFYAVCKSGVLMKNREFVNLKYYEILPEDNFAISCCIAINDGEIKKLVPNNENTIRGEVSK